MKKAIFSFFILCFLVFSFTSAIGFSTHSTTISRFFDKEETVVGEPITVTVSFVNQEDYELRGFYYTEQIPEELWVDTVNIRVNASDISCLFESGSSGEIYPGSIPYWWVLETPTFGENSPIPENSIVEIVYTVTSSQAGIFDFDEFNWVGYYETTLEGERAAFGHSADADKQMITFTEASQLPVANFSGIPRTGASPLEVFFADLSIGEIDSWSWSFGDGATSTAQNPTHTYDAAGAYTVTLEVTGPGGTNTRSETDYITIAAVTQAPVASFSGTPTSGTAPLAVSFADLSIGEINSWLWGFGDGATSTAQNPTHTYDAAGAYTVTLEVAGPGGNDTETKNNYIIITDTVPSEVRILGSWVSETLHAKEPGFNRALLFFAHAEDWWDEEIDLSSVSYGGQPMQKISERTVGTGVRAYVVAYILDEAGIAAATGEIFTPTWASFPDNTPAYSSVFLENVDQAALIGDIGSNSITSSNTLATGILSTHPGDLVIVAGTCGNAGIYSVNNDFTEAIELSIYQADGVVGYKAASGVTETPSITHSNANRQVIIGFVVQAGRASGPDLDPPNPDPMTWAVMPYAAGLHTISMTASSATDLSGVEYYFECISGGGSDSGWQASATYADTGLQPDTQYIYRVKARDKSPNANETNWSPEASATTDTVTQAPVASFSGTPTSGTAPLAVSFADLSIGEINSWLWGFGDGATSTAQNPTHTYDAAGAYTVTLEVAGPGGNDTETKNNYIIITDTVPSEVRILGSWVSETLHAKEPGFNRALLFFAHAEDWWDEEIDLSSVSYGGQPMQKISERTVGTGVRAYVVAYILDEAGIAAATGEIFTPTWASFPDNTPAYSSVFLENVDQAALIGDIGSNSITSSNTLATGILSTHPGDLVIVAGTCGNAGIYSVNNDFTEAIELSIYQADGVVGYKAASGVTETPSITHSNANRQVIIGFVVQAAIW